MTVPNENKSNRYVATSGQTIFPYDFRIIDEDHIDVHQQGTLLTITTHYTVDGVGDAGGGNVTLVTGATLNDTVTLLRNVPLTQLTDYVENDAFPAETHENALDLNVMANQQRDEEVDRALKFGVDSTQVDFVLSEPATGQYLRFTATGVDSAALADSTLAQSVDEMDTDTTKDKMVSNGLAKGWEDYKNVGHLPLAGGAITGDTTVTAEFDITGGLGVTGDAQVDNININGNTIVSTDTAGDINITPDTTGDLVLDGVKWPQADGSANYLLVTDGAGQSAWAKGLPGQTVQVVNAQDGAVATGTTVLPADDTIPQNTEGDEYITLAITPTNASNKLKIDVILNLAHSTTISDTAIALFQDATAGALAATFSAKNDIGNSASQVSLTHYMTAGTTSATTFKVRAGGGSAGTTTFNGSNSGRIFGGVMASSITITEIQV